MKLFVALLALVAVVVAKSIQDNKAQCPVCEMLVVNSEKWLGTEAGNDEKEAINLCEVEVQKMGKSKLEAKMICDVVLKGMIDDIVKELNDPDFEKEEADKVCTKLNYC